MHTLHYLHKRHQQHAHTTVTRRILYIFTWLSLTAIVAASLPFAAQVYLGKGMLRPQPPLPNPSPIIHHGSSTPSSSPTPIKPLFANLCNATSSPKVRLQKLIGMFERMLVGFRDNPFKRLLSPDCVTLLIPALLAELG